MNETATILKIPTDKCRVHEANLREADKDHVAELASEMAERGFCPSRPLEVQKQGDEYLVVSGKHRLYAAREAGVNEVYAVLIDCESEEEVAFEVVRSNRSRPMTPTEYAEHFLFMQEKFGADRITQEYYAKKSGKSQPTISNYLKVLRIRQDPSIGSFIDRLDDSALSVLARAPESARSRIAEEALEEGLSIRQMIDRVNDANRMEEYRDANREASERGLDYPDEPMKRMTFDVPLSVVTILRQALDLAEEETDEREPWMHLVFLAQFYLDRRGVSVG